MEQCLKQSVATLEFLTMGTSCILLSLLQETQAIHTTMAQGSYLEFSIPMITEETGYVSKVNGQLMHLDATTSLQFRQLLNWETFEVRSGFKSGRNDCYHRLLILPCSLEKKKVCYI